MACGLPSAGCCAASGCLFGVIDCADCAGRGAWRGGVTEGVCCVQDPIFGRTGLEKSRSVVMLHGTRRSWIIPGSFLEAVVSGAQCVQRPLCLVETCETFVHFAEAKHQPETKRPTSTPLHTHHHHQSTVAGGRTEFERTAARGNLSSAYTFLVVSRRVAPPPAATPGKQNILRVWWDGDRGQRVRRANQRPRSGVSVSPHSSQLTSIGCAQRWVGCDGG